MEAGVSSRLQQAHESRQEENGFRDIGDQEEDEHRGPEEGKHVVLTQGVELDVLHQHHVVVVLLEEGVSHGVGLRYLSREIAIGVLLGLFYGVLLAAYAMVRYDPGARSIFALPVTVGMSILTSMSVAAVVGASTPLLFNRLNIDPAVATGPIVTTSVDLLGSLVYFTVATLCLTSL